MSRSGTRPGLLIEELLSADGPFEGLADDFVTRTCTGCRAEVATEVFFHDSGYYCATCWPQVLAGA